MLRDEVQLVITGVNLTQATFTRVSADLALMARQVTDANKLLADHRTVVNGVAASYRKLDVAMAGVGFDRTALGFSRTEAAATAATAALKLQERAYADLTLAAKAHAAFAAAGPVGGGARVVGAPGVRNTVARTAAVDAALARRGRVLQSGLAERAGLGARIGAAAFGAPGLIAAGAGYVGYQLSKQAIDFQSAVRQTVAQSDPTKDMRVADQHAQQLGKMILDYTQQGTSFYTPTTIASSLVTLLSHQYSPQAVKAALPGLNTLSKMNAAPDLNQANLLLNVEAQQFGRGPKSSGAELNRYIDYTIALEKMSSVKPGEVTGAMPTLLTAIDKTGISKEEAGGLFLKTLAGNPSARLDATGMRSLLQDLTTKNTAGAMKEAGRIGLAMGPGAVDAYGGIYNYLQEINRTTLAAAHGDVQQQRRELSLILPQTGARGGALNTYLNLMQGGGLTQAMGYTSALGKASGMADVTQAELAKGVNQQATMLMTHFNTDMILVGTTLNEKVVPALLNFANDGLKKAEEFAVSMGKLGGTMDDWSRRFNLPDKAGATGSFIDQHLGPAAGFVKGMGIMIPGLGTVAALGGLDTHRNPPAPTAPSHPGAVNPHAGMHQITVGAGRHVWVPNPVQTTAPPRAAALPPGIVASHGGYENPATGQWWQTLAEVPRAVTATTIPAIATNTAAAYQSQFNPGRHLYAMQANQGRLANDAAQAAAHQAYIIKTVDNDIKIAAMIASENTPAKLSASAQNQATRDARTQLNTDISKSLGRDVYNKDLVNLAGALGTSVYTQAQQQGIITFESKKVGKLNLGDDQASLKTGLAQYKLGNLSTQDLRTLLKNELSDIPFSGLSKAKQQALGYTAGQQVNQAIYIQTQLDAANMQLHAAQINQESARIHHASFATQEKDARATYAATQFAIKAKIDHGDLKGVDIKAAYDQAKDTLDTSLAAIAQQKLTPFQDKITLAQLRGDPAAYKKAVQGEIAFYKTPDSLKRLFGGSADAQAVAVLQAQQQIANFTRVPGPQLIRPNTQGLGFGLAGPSSTIAQLSGGTGGPAETIALLQAQLRKDDQTISELRQMVAYMRTMSQGVAGTEKNTRPKPAPPPRGRSGHGGGRATG